MYRRPDRKLAAFTAALVALPLLGGCVQATRHSNTMVFGTSTTVGLKVGQDVNQVPQVLIAYDRQEAVIMPLLANTGEKSNSGNLLSPCPAVAPNSPPKPPAELTSDEKFAHPCKFVGVRKSEQNLEIQDSYSVLASFGARIEGEAADTKGTVGIAQYFATGVAAQLLAATGGAAVVSVGSAAESSASNPDKANAAAAVLGEDAFPVGAGQTFSSEIEKLRSAIRATPVDSTRQRKIEALYSNLTPVPAFKAFVVQDCLKSVEDCVAAIDGDVASLRRSSNLGTQVANWDNF
uniref:hypothetical protein n=1 Tax=Parerythrobacter lutipelagi TaxID=1964208 RepID=UPI0010F7265A|nr:hypothetical protein [Parerythrobacter lutipelagi]